MYAWPGSGVSPSHSSTPTMEVTGSESVLIDDVAYINSKCVCVWGYELILGYQVLEEPLCMHPFS